MSLLKYTCDTCGGAADRGALYIGYDEIRQGETALAEWKRRDEERSRTRGERDLDWLLDLLSMPEPVPWKVGCNECAGTCEQAYWIEVDRVRTWPALLQWTVHLSAKTWFTATDWTAFLKRLAEANEPPVADRRVAS